MIGLEPGLDVREFFGVCKILSFTGFADVHVKGDHHIANEVFVLLEHKNEFNTKTHNDDYICGEIFLP